MASVNFYTLNCDPRLLNKSLGTDYVSITSSTNIKIKEPCDIINPVLVINKSFGDAALGDCNYIQIPSAPFNNRFYFVNSITVGTGGRYILSCSVDYLNSFKSEINNLTAWISRNENDKSAFLRDENYIYSSSQRIEQIEFPSQPLFPSLGASRNYVLTVAGGNGGEIK